jgi:hypothetical protein
MMVSYRADRTEGKNQGQEQAMEDSELKQLLRDGITAARAGEKERARILLLRVIEQNERSEPAWLWLSGVVDETEERRICLENVLTINPKNAAAQAGLRFLGGSGFQ